MKNKEGEFVSSEERAETLATHLENVQWAVRPLAAIPDRPLIGGTLPICTATITVEEVRAAIKRLKRGKAAVDISAEFLKSICEEEGTHGIQWVTRLMQLCWETKSVPTAWHLAQVILVYTGDSMREAS